MPTNPCVVAARYEIQKPRGKGHPPPRHQRSPSCLRCSRAHVEQTSRARLRVDVGAGSAWPLWAGAGRGAGSGLSRLSRLFSVLQAQSTCPPTACPSYHVALSLLSLSCRSLLPSNQCCQHSPCPHDRPWTLFCPLWAFLVHSSFHSFSSTTSGGFFLLFFHSSFCSGAGLACILLVASAGPGLCLLAEPRHRLAVLFVVLSRCVFHPSHAERSPHPTKLKRPKPLSILKKTSTLAQLLVCSPIPELLPPLTICSPYFLLLFLFSLVPVPPPCASSHPILPLPFEFFPSLLRTSCPSRPLPPLFSPPPSKAYRVRVLCTICLFLPTADFRFTHSVFSILFSLVACVFFPHAQSFFRILVRGRRTSHPLSGHYYQRLRLFFLF